MSMSFSHKAKLAATALLLALPGCAATIDSAPLNGVIETPVAANAFDRGDADPALWVIKDEDTTIYLFGTIHLLEPDIVWFDDAVADAFNASSELVLEMIEPDAATVQQAMVSRAIATDGITLRDRLSDGERTKYDAALGEFGMAPAAFDRFKPWMAAITLSILPLQKIGFDPEKGVERTILQSAGKRRITVSAVETFDEQIGIFDSLPVADQTAFLMGVIDGLPELKTTMDRMVAAWGTGNLDDLAALMNESMETTPTLGKALLADRNRRWAAWLDDRMDRPGIVFLAVGAGHLAGNDNVQAFLAERGMTAQRIDY